MDKNLVLELSVQSNTQVANFLNSISKNWKDKGQRNHRRAEGLNTESLNFSRKGHKVKFPE